MRIAPSVVALVAGWAACTPRIPADHDLRGRPCWFDAPSSETVRCDSLARPDGTVLAIARFTPASGVVAAEPLLVLTGGPGQDAATIVRDSIAELRALAGRRTIVAIDPRGTGATTPSLACPERVAARPGSEFAAATEACRRRLGRERIDRRLATTRALSDDIDAARRAMGIERWNLLGFSYGTRLALTLARDHPASVRAMVLSSVIPLEVDPLGDRATNARRAIARLAERCADDDRCARVFPSLEAALVETAAALDAAPWRVEVAGRTSVLRGRALVQLVVRSLMEGGPTDRMVALVSAVARRDLEPVRSTLERWTHRGDFSDGTNLSIQCADEWPFTVSRAEESPDDVLIELVSAIDPGDECRIWDVPASPPSENRAAKSAIPTLIFDGELDPVSPPDYAAAAHRSLSSSTIVSFAEGGHAVGMEGGCAAVIARSFFARLAVRDEDRRCVDGLE